jgi:hypothetical protein
MTLPGGIYFGPLQPSLDDIKQAHLRPQPLRTPPPQPGDTVWYRHSEFGELVDATVVSVVMDNMADPNVWHVVTVGGQPVTGPDGTLMEVGPDPWPVVFLTTPFGRVQTREARVTGSAGWLPRGGT